MKILIKKRKKYLYESFKKWDSEYFQIDEVFDDYMDNEGLEGIIGDEGIQNLNTYDKFCGLLIFSYIDISVIGFFWSHFFRLNFLVTFDNLLPSKNLF